MSNSAKRTRLSGAEYKKKRIARELELSKQKDRILNFFQQVPSSNNNISSENSEIENDNTSVCSNMQANVELGHHNISACNLEKDGNLTIKTNISPHNENNFIVSSVNIKKDQYESIECDKDLLNVGNKVNNISLSIVKDVTLLNNSNCEMVKENDQDFSVNTPADSFDLQLLKDPKKWPAICDKIRMLLV